MGGIKINRQYGPCFLCRQVKELQRDGSLQGHPLARANPRGERCPGGGRLPRGNGESYIYGRRVMDFGEALQALRRGHAVRRELWNPDCRLILVPGSKVTVAADRPLGVALPDAVGMELLYDPHIDLAVRVIDKFVAAPWDVTTRDLLADDWMIVSA